jgi:octaprenyl-diphosphate synthase
MLRMKTAELFALSCDLGASLSGAMPAERTALRDYGMALGTAYQIYDDCLDLFGSEAEAGKSLGTDLAGGKLTLPVVVALERAGEVDRQSLENMVTHWEAALLPRLIGLLKLYHTPEESRTVIHELCASAGRSLQVLQATQGQCALAGVAQFLACRADELGRSLG